MRHSMETRSKQTKKNKMKTKTKIDRCRAGSLVKWLWDETHVLKVMGSNPSAIY